MGCAAARDAGLDIRSNTVRSPVEGSFAKYLKQTLSVELAAVGLLDPASDRVIHGGGGRARWCSAPTLRLDHGG